MGEGHRREGDEKLKGRGNNPGVWVEVTAEGGRSMTVTEGNSRVSAPKGCVVNNTLISSLPPPNHITLFLFFFFFFGGGE